MNDLTFVVLTFNNRKHLLLRTLSHYKNLPLTVYILDASITAIDICEIATALEETKFRYIHIPESSADDRLLYIAEHVKTDFVSLHCDDEFYSHASIVDSISFLRKNIDYVSCMGFAVGFRETGREVKFYDVYPELLKVNQNIEDPVTRAHKLARRYTCSTIYAVNRTASWNRAITVAMSVQGKKRIFAIQEYIFEITMALEGKRKILNRPHWFRNLGPAADTYLYPIPSQAWFLKEFKGIRDNIINRLAHYIETSLRVTSGEAQLISAEILETFVISNARVSFEDYSDLSSLKMGIRNAFPSLFNLMSKARRTFHVNQAKREISLKNQEELVDGRLEGESKTTNALKCYQGDLNEIRGVLVDFLINKSCRHRDRIE